MTEAEKKLAKRIAAVEKRLQDAEARFGKQEAAIERLWKTKS